MQYKALIVFILLWNIHLYSYDIFCKKEFQISLIPFLWDQDPSQGSQEDLKFLETGIPRMILSNLKTQFFVEGIKIPLVKIKILNTNQDNCKNFTLVKILLIENTQVPIEPKKEIPTQLLNLSLQNQYDGVLTGILTKKEQRIIIKVIYLNSYDKNDSFEKEYEISYNDPYSEKNQNVFLNIANDFFTYMMKKNKNSFNIASSISDYKVYVNDISYGTNLKQLLLPSANFKITLFSENCKEEFFTEDLINNTIQFDCKNIELQKILIKSEPENTAVYIDDVFYGNTPIELELPKKIYRLRLNKEGYIDKFIIVDLVNHNKNTFFSKLEKGDNESFYYKKSYFASNWTYYDVSFGFALQSLIFAGGWAYSNIQKEKALDSIRSPIIQDYFYDPLRLTTLQFIIIENARKKSLYWHRQSQIYGGLGFLSLLASGYFFYKGIEIDLGKTYEYGSISFKFNF